ncbi:MAG TPA: ethanolamine ammonia-lyase subunit EutC [Rhizomicrobium sp.]
MSDADEWEALAALTPARVALGRAGHALPTKRVLEFQLAHARARDAVNAPFDASALARELDALCLKTLAGSRTDYLANPDLGRTPDAASRARLVPGAFDAALVVADGLSSTAIAAHGATLARLIRASLPELSWAPVTVVTNGRVAVGDHIAQALGATLAVVMIGERPGLSAADSVGLYLTFHPRAGATKDAERNCISNVRPDGLALGEAAHRLAWLARHALKLGATGVDLKEDAPERVTDESAGG